MGTWVLNGVPSNVQDPCWKVKAVLAIIGATQDPLVHHITLTYSESPMSGRHSDP